MSSEAKHLFPTVEEMASCVDFYELTMAAAYFTQRISQVATFELSIRKMPHHRAYLVFAGLEQALHYLADLRFSRGTVHYLRRQPQFARVPRAFFDYLAQFKFTGDVCAMPEGTVIFPNEPILYVRAPMIEAQIVETYLLATINYQTAVASKAARVVQAAKNHSVAEFGARRAPGPQAGLLAARAAYIAGCTSTSNVLAARVLGIPPSGTQAHSWVMAFDSEQEAFRRYAEVFPKHCTLLIDTYDTVKGAEHAAELGTILRAVRLDSGDLVALSRQVRHILDRAKLQHVKIIVSGDLDEYRIDALLRAHAPVDFFGVGSEMVTSRDDPAMGGIYKLVQVQRDHTPAPAVKLSSHKSTLPYMKQVRRMTDGTGKFRRDVICLPEERMRGEALLQPMMRGGRFVSALPALSEVRHHCREQINRLTLQRRALNALPDYPVLIGPHLKQAARKAARSRRGIV